MTLYRYMQSSKCRYGPQQFQTFNTQKLLFKLKKLTRKELYKKINLNLIYYNYTYPSI